MVDILWRKFMPTNAMRFYSIARRRSYTASDVHRTCHSFKVCRIDAATEATLVVNLKPVRDRPPFDFISDDVSLPHFAVNTNAPVAAALAAVQCPKPNQATGIGLWYRHSVER